MTDETKKGGQMDHPFPTRRQFRESRIPQSSRAAESAGRAPVQKVSTPVKSGGETVERRSIADRDVRPVAPKPEHGYPSRTVVHGTGILPKVVVEPTKAKQVRGGASDLPTPEAPSAPAETSGAGSTTKPVRPASRTGEIGIGTAEASSQEADPKPEGDDARPPTAVGPDTRAEESKQKHPARQGTASSDVDASKKKNEGETPAMGGRTRPPRTSSKRRGRPSGLRTALILTLLVALLGGAAYLAYPALIPAGNGTVEEDLDYPGPGEGEVEVTIMPGDMGTDIGQALVDAGVVKTVEGFKRAFDANSAAATIKPGTYTLKKGMTSAAALAALLDEANRSDNAITVNPGQTVAQVTEKMVSVSGFSQEEVEEALAAPDTYGLPAEAGGNPEGWLAAGAYEVHSDSTPASVLTSMVQKTVDELAALDVPQDEWMTVLTKASILEREVGSPADMAKVARVIENRLDASVGETVGLLQMDSTVLYGVGKSGGIPTTADLESNNPYNTYLNAGLPPAPIATPSLAAIEATLDPDEGDWLYFVTIDLDTGETRFSSNIEEQEANTLLLREWCEANPGKC